MLDIYIVCWCLLYTWSLQGFWGFKLMFYALYSLLFLCNMCKGNSDISYSNYIFICISSCMFVDGNGGNCEVYLEEFRKSKADKLCKIHWTVNQLVMVIHVTYYCDEILYDFIHLKKAFLLCSTFCRKASRWHQSKWDKT